MTWLKKSDDFGDECARLSDAAYRTHDEALLWVMRREVGPRFPKRELRRFAETDDPETAARELVALGFWLDLGDAFEVVHHMQHQVEPEVLVRRREMDANRQRRSRFKRAGLPTEEPVSRRDGMRDDMRDPGLVGSGLDGKDNYSPTEEVEAEPSKPEVVADPWSARDPWAHASTNDEQGVAR